MNAIIELLNIIGQKFVENAFTVLVQSSLLIAILLILDLLLRKKVRAVFRYWMWMLVLLKLVLPISLSTPVSLGHWFGDKLANIDISQTTTETEAATKNIPARTTTVSPYIDLSKIEKGFDRFAAASTTTKNKPAVIPVAPNFEAGKQEAIESAKPLSAPAILLSWQGIVFILWLAIITAMTLLLLQRVMFVRGLIRQSCPANNLMNDALEYCKNRMGVTKNIDLKVSVNATSPAVCGLFRPVILLPRNLGPTLGSSHLRTVMMHELAHIKRGDLWINTLQTALQIVYFYNPLLWLANAIIRSVREQAVDETVLVAMGSRAQHYPETLLNVARLAFARPALSLRLIGVIESKSQLKERIKKMLERPVPKTAKLGIVGMLIVIALGAFLLPMAKADDNSSDTFVVSKQDNKENDAELKMLREQIAQLQKQLRQLKKQAKQKQTRETTQETPVVIEVAPSKGKQPSQEQLKHKQVQLILKKLQEQNAEGDDAPDVTVKTIVELVQKHMQHIDKEKAKAKAMEAKEKAMAARKQATKSKAKSAEARAKAMAARDQAMAAREQAMKVRDEAMARVEAARKEAKKASKEKDLKNQAKAKIKELLEAITAIKNQSFDADADADADVHEPEVVVIQTPKPHLTMQMPHPMPMPEIKMPQMPKLPKLSALPKMPPIPPMNFKIDTGPMPKIEPPTEIIKQLDAVMAEKGKLEKEIGKLHNKLRQKHGNLSEEQAEEISNKIESLEQKLEQICERSEELAEQLEEWGEQVEESMESWSEGFEEQFEKQFEQKHEKEMKQLEKQMKMYEQQMEKHHKDMERFEKHHEGQYEKEIAQYERQMEHLEKQMEQLEHQHEQKFEHEQEQYEHQMEQYEHQMEQWAEQLEHQMEQWAERFEDEIETSMEKLEEELEEMEEAVEETVEEANDSKSNDGKVSFKKGPKEFSIPVTQGKKIVVNNHIGTIKISSGKAGQCKCTATIEAKDKAQELAKQKAESVKIEVDDNDDALILTAIRPGDKWDDIEVDLEIQVPQNANIAVNNEIGAIKLNHLKGKIQVKNNIGDIAADNIQGDVKLFTEVGKINCDLPDDISAEVNVSTDVGSITTKLPLEITKSDLVKSKASGVLGQGGKRIELKTKVGNVTIR